MAEGGRLRTLWNNYNTKETESNKKRQRPGSNDDLSCAKCDKDVDHRDLSCSGCKLLYCEQCTGLSKSVYACVRAGELGEFLWSCKSCKNTLPTLENINSTLKEIQSSNVTRFKNIEDRLQIVEKNSGQEFINNIKTVNAKLCEGLLVIRTSNILKITGPKPLLLVRRIFCIFVIFLNKNDVQKDNLCLLG